MALTREGAENLEPQSHPKIKSFWAGVGFRLQQAYRLVSEGGWLLGGFPVKSPAVKDYLARLYGHEARI